MGEHTAEIHIDHMGAPNDFGRKFGRKSDQNFTIFFFQKIDIKNRSETQFHKKRTNIRDFRFTTARHENSTPSESGGNSNPHSQSQVKRAKSFEMAQKKEQ